MSGSLTPVVASMMFASQSTASQDALADRPRLRFERRNATAEVGRVLRPNIYLQRTRRKRHAAEAMRWASTERPKATVPLLRQRGVSFPELPRPRQR
jgi:DNA topoisomerase VI subunit B